MADAADRREARRKRILENSENRLRIISGLNKVDDSGESVLNSKSNGPVTSLPVENETKPTLTKCDTAPNSPVQGSKKVCFSEEVKFFQSSSKHDNHEMEPVIPSLDESMGASLPQSELPKSILFTLIKARLYLVGLAIIVRLLLSSNHGYLFGDSIFVPLFTLQLARYFGTAPDSNNSGGGGIINAALILSGISSQQINLLNKTLGFVKDFLADFYIYFFTFIMMHVFLEITVY